MVKPRYFLPFRRIGNKKAIIFLHGLLGEVGVWTPMAKLLLSDPELADWDIYSLGYRTTVLFQPFSEEPSLENQCELLYTNLALAPIARYESLAFVAHSAGGLVLQRALVNFDDVLLRTTHAFFFGTPSTGSYYARRWAFLNAQLRDMAQGSDFIRRLRRDWTAKFQGEYPFYLEAIAGEKDSKVRMASVRQPFSETDLRIVEGDHNGMIQPTSSASAAYRVVKDGLMMPRPRAARTTAYSGSARRGGKVFVSYSHEDVDWLTSITDVLTLALGRDSLDIVWDNKLLEAGDKWRPRIEETLDQAGFAVLLVTTPFLASAFIRETELPRLLQRKQGEPCVLFPITLSTIDYEDPRLKAVEADARHWYDELLKLEFANELKMPLAKVGSALQGSELLRIARKIKSRIERD
jgi:pimeloyl-ACP methyl ester carboxylesterase